LAAVIASVALAFVVLCIPVVPQNVTALQLGGGYLLTDNSKPQGGQSPSAFEQLAQAVSRNSTFIAATGGKNYTFSYVDGEAGVGWSEAILVYETYSNQLVDICGTLDKVMTDQIYVGFNTTLPLAELMNMSNPSEYLYAESFTIRHEPGINVGTCVSYNPPRPPTTFSAESSLLFDVTGFGITYAPDWGLILKI